MPDNIDDKIEPVGFDADSSPFDSVQSSVTISSKPSNRTWLVLGVLIIVALGVIFVLPTIVTEYQLPFEKRAELDISVAPKTSAPGINTISPFDQAQRSRQRKEAQDVLATLLERQAILEDAQVRTWAEEPYLAAYEVAFTSGDEAYRSQEFIQAKDYYRRAGDEFQTIIESIPEVVSQYLSAGESALENVDAAMARENFSTVLALDSENEQAISGFNRAQTLDEVESLLNEGRVLNEVGKLEEAKDLYRQAVNLDQLHVEAKALVVQIDAEILVARFTRLMSEGFALLEGGDYDEAIEEFRRAQAVGYNSEQAVAAIDQAQNQITSNQISAIQISAQKFEDAESWEPAVSQYANALELDQSLAQVIDKKDYAEKRLQLDQLLQSAIDSPERLAERPVYDQILNVYYTGQQIEDPGPRLQDQLVVLESLLLNSQIAIDVIIQSDSITDVTLLKVGHLGSFENTTLALKPGRYVVVGRRDGYRDVREEFVIGYGGKQTSPVFVACSEQINGR